MEEETNSSELDELSKDYRRSGFAIRLGFGAAPALLLVDFSFAYLVPDSPLYAGEGGPAAVAAAAQLLAVARSQAIPVIHTRVCYQPGGADGGLFYRKIPSLSVFDAGSPLAESPAELAPREGELVITKQYPSAFFGTTLASVLTQTRVDTLLIAGVSTSGCVRATAVDSMQFGFVPCVIREAVADRDPRPHEQALVDVEAKYGDVVSLSEVVEYLERC